MNKCYIVSLKQINTCWELIVISLYHCEHRKLSERSGLLILHRINLNLLENGDRLDISFLQVSGVTNQQRVATLDVGGLQVSGVTNEQRVAPLDVAGLQVSVVTNEQRVAWGWTWLKYRDLVLLKAYWNTSAHAESWLSVASIILNIGKCPKGGECLY